LIEHCPNLEHLAIDGHSSHAPVDAHGLVRGRWPKLRSLLLAPRVTSSICPFVCERDMPTRSFENRRGTTVDSSYKEGIPPREYKGHAF
ncbi:hypothetical protein BJV78DRAFT_1225961, partial [Lactifluus subvellereus]